MVHHVPCLTLTGRPSSPILGCPTVQTNETSIYLMNRNISHLGNDIIVNIRLHTIMLTYVFSMVTNFTNEPSAFIV